MSEEGVGTKAFQTTKSLSPAATYSLLAVVPEVASGLQVSGVFIVTGSNGMTLGSLATGETATGTNTRVAHGKIRTVLATHRSTRLQKAWMREKHQFPSDFGGALGSLLGGGVAVFADPDHTEFVGALAFSGGTELQDEDFCLDAIRLSNLTLYTDVGQ